MQAKLKYALSALAFATAISGCSDSKQYETAYCALIDISGTYASEKASVVNTVKAGIVPQMIPGDSLFFVMIDSNSYSEDNLVTKLTLDYRPTTANEQKLKVAKSDRSTGPPLWSMSPQKQSTSPPTPVQETSLHSALPVSTVQSCCPSDSNTVPS